MRISRLAKKGQMEIPASIPLLLSIAVMVLVFLIVFFIITTIKETGNTDVGKGSIIQNRMIETNLNYRLTIMLDTSLSVTTSQSIFALGSTDKYLPKKVKDILPHVIESLESYRNLFEGRTYAEFLIALHASDIDTSSKQDIFKIVTYAAFPETLFRDATHENVMFDVWYIPRGGDKFNTLTYTGGASPDNQHAQLTKAYLPLPLSDTQVADIYLIYSSPQHENEERDPIDLAMR